MGFRPYKGIFEGLFISVVVSVLFYDSWIGMLVAIPLIPVMIKRDKKRTKLWNQKRMKEEFRKVMVFVSGNLNAGYSLENAFLQVNKTEGKNFSVMKPELQRIENGLMNGARVEDLLHAFAGRCDLQDIEDFAQLIETAKCYGGNISKLIRQMTDNFTNIEAAELEIETVIAAKRFEAHIMLVVPFAIVLLLRLINPSYIQVIYESALGHIWMTVCVIALIGCATWMERIVRIEV